MSKDQGISLMTLSAILSVCWLIFCYFQNPQQIRSRYKILKLSTWLAPYSLFFRWKSLQTISRLKPQKNARMRSITTRKKSVIDKICAAFSWEFSVLGRIQNLVGISIYDGLNLTNWPQEKDQCICLNLVGPVPMSPCVLAVLCWEFEQRKC